MSLSKKALQDQNQPISDEKSNRQKFVDMENIRPLLIMLDWKWKQDFVKVPVIYPPGDKNMRTKEYLESFRWFAHENQRDIKRRKHQLRTPQEIISKTFQEGYPPSELPLQKQDNNLNNQRNRQGQNRGNRRQK